MQSEAVFKLISYRERQPLPDPTERRLVVVPGAGVPPSSYVDRLKLWVDTQPDAPILRALFAALCDQPQAFVESVVNGTVTLTIVPPETGG